MHKGRPRKHERSKHGAWLRFLRKEKGFTQEGLAIELEFLLGKRFAASTIAFWEGCGNLSGRHVIAGLAKALDVSTGTIIKLDLKSSEQVIREIQASPPHPDFVKVVMKKPKL